MLDLKKAESEILGFWEKEKIYEKVKAKNKKGKRFYFLQGPPYTSGKLHAGHAWNNSLKDMIMRYKRMQGFNVWDRGGYDMHGLPTEHAVQKKLGLKTKDDILKYGMDKFVKECMDFSIEHAGYMSEDLWKLGVWMDHEGAYKPIEKEFIDGEWAFFKAAWDQKRLYKGKKVMHWDAETETSVAKHELEYENVKDTSIFLKFKKKGSENEYFIIWTTTPWTIPYNLAIMVNPKVEYVKVKVDNELWVLAKDLASVFILGLLGKKLNVVEKFKGRSLLGQEYIHPLYDELKEQYDSLKKEWKNVHTVILSEEYVETSAGTGLVHCAPGCGPEDFEVGKEYGLGAYNTLNERGEIEELGKYSNWVAKRDDKKFIKEFEEKGALVAKSVVEHEYPHSWRSHKPVVFRATEQWFLKIQDLVPKLLKFNDKVSWVPKKSGDSYDRWTENLKDNSVTRQRFWGCPIPLWECSCGKVEVIGSVKDLEKKTGKKFDDLKIHKPWIDKIKLKCKTCGKDMSRIPDVADVWIDSGTASWNCLHNSPDLIEKWYPADLVLEGTEHTRLWFNMLQICASIKFNKSSYKNSFVHGMLLDYQGTKMSKSLGNILSPYEVIEKYSVDILRNYFCEVAAGENINFNWEDIKVKQRNLIMLGNIANYILDLEKQNIKPGPVGFEEKWILSRYNSTLKRVTDLFEEYKLDEIIGEVEKLFILLSRDYIKLVREKSGENSAVLKTVKEVYLGILKMFAPVVPFLTDSLWQKMNQKEKSIHLCDWPKVKSSAIDKKLEKLFEDSLQVIERGLAARDKEGIGLKWPLKKASVTLTAKSNPPNYLKEIIMKQLNVKTLDFKQGKELAVKLDTKLTPELEAEGFSREIARRIQSERKARGLEKRDQIELKLLIGSELKDKLKVHESFIKKRTGSKNLVFVDDKTKDMIEFKVKGKTFLFSF